MRKPEITAEEYLKVYLGGNMFVETLTPFAIAEFAEDYHKKRIGSLIEQLEGMVDEFENDPQVSNEGMGRLRAYREVLKIINNQGEVS